MSQRQIFFYDKNATPDGKRALPLDTPDGDGLTAVANRNEFLYDEADPRTPEQLAEEILEELCAPHTHLIARQSPVPLSAVFGLLGEFLTPYASVTVVPMEGPSSPVAVSSHSLYYVIGMLVHYTVKYDIPLTVRATEEDEPTILLEIDRPARSEDEAAAAFLLDREARLETLRKVAAASGFSVALRCGERAAVAFTLARSYNGTLRLQAVSDSTLYAAFMLPLSHYRF